MTKVRYIFLILLINLFPDIIAQEGDTVFDFLKLPYSARASAMGGTNISLVERDPSLVFQNPGLLGSEMDNGLNLTYLVYLADINAASAVFTKAAGDRGAWAIGANYLNYGNIRETTAENIHIGDLSVKDIAVNAVYAHDITESIRGGITVKWIYSSFVEFTSMGIGVDLGLSYYNPESEFSLGLTAKHLGRQIKAYHEERFPLPLDIQFGISKRFAHAPLRISATAIRLNKWQTYSLTGKKDAFAANFFKHCIFAFDFIPTENFWAGIGYNVKTGADMSIEHGNKLGGFSGGAGIRVRSFEVGASAGIYHPSATSLMISLTNFF